MTKDELVQHVYYSLPFANQIKNLDTVSEKSAIRFKWRDSNYRISLALFVEEIANGCLVSSDKAILMKTCLERGL